VRRLLPSLLVLCAISGIVSGCYEDNLFNSLSVQGPTRVFLTDAPFPIETVGTVEVYVVEISASTEADTSVGWETWTRIATPSQRVDLMRLQQSTLALVGEQVISADVYRALRVTINTDSSSVTFRDGSEADVLWTGSGNQSIFAHLPAPIVIPDSGTSIVIDFDIGQSFAFGLGDPGYDFYFTPVVRAVDGAKTGSISGTVLSDLDGDGNAEPVEWAEISVLRDGSQAEPGDLSHKVTGRTDSTGYYKVGFLHPATYTIQIDAAASESLQTLFVYDIEVSAGEDFTFSVTLPARSAAGNSSWR